MNDSSGYATEGPGGMDSAYNWGGYADSEGRYVDMSTLSCPEDRIPIDCLQEAGGAYRVEIYVPDSEYPQMMLIISGLNLIIAITLLAAGAQTLRRCDL